MNDKRRKYAAVVSAEPKLLDRYPTSIHRIEEELVYRLTDPIVEEAIKGECIVRLTETEQQKGFPTYMIAFRKYVYIEEIVRCNDCAFFESGIRCGLRNEQTDCNGFCSKGRRKKLMNEEEKEPVYCRECKHALLAEYNEGIDVCCLKGGKRKTVSMLDTCEEGEER